MGLGSTLMRVLAGPPLEELQRVEPLEGTNMSLFNSQIPNWWSENITGTYLPGNALLAERVWVSNRCIQLNAQQIAAMPLQHQTTSPLPPEERAWMTSPDPHWYPNGISDALFAIVANIYGWGYSCQYITSFYADGFARYWTVLDPSTLTIKLEDGSRQYKIGELVLDPDRVVQIDRNPGAAVSGTSAIKAYAQNAWGLLAAGNQSMTVNQGGTPKFYLQMLKKINREQAEAVQNQWMERTAARNGAPPVIPPELEPKEMSFDPADLALLETQEFNARAIASAFGVPAMLLNMSVTGGLTYQNPAMLGEFWWRFELRTLAKRIADAWSARLLPRGQTVTFDAADTFAPLTAQSEEDDPQGNPIPKPAAPVPVSPPALSSVGGNQ